MVGRIASLHFAPLHGERVYGAFADIPAQVRGAEKPFVVEVPDVIQRYAGSYSESGDGKHRPTKRHLIFGRDVANDFVDEWTKHGVGMNPECHPAVWVVREHIPVTQADGKPVIDEMTGGPVFRDATEAEKAQMWQEDLAANTAAGHAYGQYLILFYNVQYTETPLKFIPGSAKLACRFFGFDAEWSREVRDLAARERPCQYCTKTIPRAAMVCPHCHQVVDAERYAQEQKKLDAALGTAKLQPQKKLIEATV